jgi:hypothetical protein
MTSFCCRLCGEFEWVEPVRRDGRPAWLCLGCGVTWVHDPAEVHTLVCIEEPDDPEI